MKVEMDYSFLRGKIVENCKGMACFAKKLGISNQELSNKLNNKSSFSQKQMYDSIGILRLTDSDFKKCFFCTLQVENNSTR